MKDIKQIAPIQILVLGFDKPKFEGKIMSEINKLRNNNTIRIIDSLVVHKDEDGFIHAMQITDLPKNERVEYGAYIGALIGLGMGDEETAQEMALGKAMLVDNEYEYGMTSEELDTIAEDILPSGAALMLLIEHVWALPFKNAARDAGARIIAQDFLSPETLIAIGQKLIENES